MKKRILTFLFWGCLSGTLAAQSVRQQLLLNNDWRFAYGHAADKQKDFTHGTEYFTYLTKAQAHNQNRGPSWTAFNDSTWARISLPHDWVVDLPYSAAASHSHGYKTVGWNHPENSVGWYRRRFYLPESDRGSHIEVRFDGIFRDAQVFCNGFYLGGEPSGYATQLYDLTEYLNYGGENILCVRVDASMEEGWFYEGAGIYRNVWLLKTAPLHVKEFGTFVTSTLNDSLTCAQLHISTQVANDALEALHFEVIQRLLAADGREVARTRAAARASARTSAHLQQSLTVNQPLLWSLEQPHLYTLQTEIYREGVLTDSYPTSVGIRTVRFDADRGFFLNGRAVKLKGTNIHQDHAGVGSGIPDELWRYRLERLKELGCNAIRCSHNPASPALLDLCDRMGVLVIAENRLMGVNDVHFDLLSRMVVRDRNHPSIILWSVGNEEWAIEGNERGRDIARTMTAFLHTLDTTRLSTYGNSGGRTLEQGVEVAGYNYFIQNGVDNERRRFPQRRAYGSEETTGSGTRGVYFPQAGSGRMVSLNRLPADASQPLQVIERGWKFYAGRPWLAGVFFWTGFDYRGEPNPLSFPATGSQFGILDYCGFPKDEAFYLQAWWSQRPVLHLSPHWNLQGHEGDTVRVCAYTNCDEVELWVNAKRLKKQRVPPNGHVSWTTRYMPGRLLAKGYKNGRLQLRREIATTTAPAHIVLRPHKDSLRADGQDLIVVDLSITDAKGREVPDANLALEVTVSGGAVILGYGNGDSAFDHVERPLPADHPQPFGIHTFNGKAQLLLRSVEGAAGTVQLSVVGGARMHTHYTIPLF
ncbi:MAG: DUF4982 domain-containing protein [Prevotellaceae bacterium]|jgi:beta-galactosidase|nr:DUF4982 domain-containing protein [Prevotellaceae bacterium]